MTLKGASWELTGLLVRADHERSSLYTSHRGPLKTYPRIDLRFEGDSLIPEKPFREANDFPSALYVQDKWGQVCEYRP
jgi:hypothetical protein